MGITEIANPEYALIGLALVENSDSTKDCNTTNCNEDYVGYPGETEIVSGEDQHSHQNKQYRTVIPKNFHISLRDGLCMEAMNPISHVSEYYRNSHQL